MAITGSRDAILRAWLLSSSALTAGHREVIMLLMRGVRETRRRFADDERPTLADLRRAIGLADTASVEPKRKDE